MSSCTRNGELSGDAHDVGAISAIAYERHSVRLSEREGGARVGSRRLDFVPAEPVHAKTLCAWHEPDLVRIAGSCGR